MNPINGKPFSQKYLDAREAMSRLPATRPEVKKELFALLDKNDVILLTGETGAGKSLIVPMLTLEYFKYKEKVVCSQPRTVNASTIATGVAEVVADVELGKEVGYKYKYNNKSSDSTLLLYTTDGTLLSMCFKTPDFSPYACVLIDEAHERNMNIDLVLFFIREHLRKKDARKVKFVIMSATAQMEQFKEYFKGCALGEIFISGRTFPVTQHFNDKSLNGKYRDAIAERLKSIVNDEISPKWKKGAKEQSDILVFLPSKREIDQLCMQINTKLVKDFALKCVCVPLYSGLDKDQELLATDESKYKKLPGSPDVKIVASTNLAETGVTVKGITYVVDSGYEYESTFDPVLRESTLANKFIPKAAVKQRMGRAGRTKPGICYHMYTRAEYEKFDDYKHAEITTGNIDGVLLKMMHYGKSVDEKKVGDILSKLIEPPAKARVEATMKYLKELGVLAADGTLTETGLCVYRLNMDVPVALFLIGCKRHGVETAKALTLASIMLVDRSYQGWFRPPNRMLPDYRDQMKKYETLQSKYTSDVAELLALADLYEDFRAEKLARWKKWVNLKHLMEVPRSIRQIQKNYEAMEAKCTEALPAGKKLPAGATYAQTIVECLRYGFGNQVAILKSKSSPVYKFEVRGQIIETAPEEGNGLSEFNSHLIYFDLSNILGTRKINGLVNI